MDDMGMMMYFFFSSSANDLLFKGWNITTKEEFALSCLLFAFASVILEVLATLSTYLTRRCTTDTLERNRSSPVDGSTPLLVSDLHNTVSLEVKQHRCLIHFGWTIVHILSVSLGYMVMLVVMSYNAYFLISVAAGSALGYFLFAPFRKRPKKKTPPVDRPVQGDSLTRSGQMDVGGETSHAESSAGGSSHYGAI